MKESSMTVHYSGEFWERMLSEKDPDDTDFSRSLPDEELKTFCDLHLKSGARVLDLGCGGGRNAHYLAARGFQVYGVDVSPSAVSFTARRLARFGLRGTFLQGEMAALPFTPGFFGGIVCAAALDHVTLDRAHLALAEMRRAKTPPAKIYITFDPIERMAAARKNAQIQSDGSFYFHDGKKKGMLFRSYSDQEIMELIGKDYILSFEQTHHGDRVIVCT